MPSKRLSILFGLLLIGIIILVVQITSGQPVLERVSEVVSIGTSLAVIYAIIKYYDDKNEAQVLSVLDQLSFFREKVLVSSASAQKKIIAHMGENYNPLVNRIGYIQEFEYPWVYLKYREKILEQTKYSKCETAAESITETLNATEEFAWNVILHKTISHPSLLVVRETFCEIVESLAHQALFLRLDKEEQFEGIRQIYAMWAPDCDRRTPEQKIEAGIERAKEYIK